MEHMSLGRWMREASKACTKAGVNRPSNRAMQSAWDSGMSPYFLPIHAGWLKDREPLMPIFLPVHGSKAAT